MQKSRTKISLEEKVDILIARAEVLTARVKARNGVGSGREITGAVSTCWIDEEGNKVCGYKIETLKL